MMLWLAELWGRFYEGDFTRTWLRPYRFNPCDVGASPKLHVLGRALTALGSQCRCCSGARVAAALALGALAPRAAAFALAFWVGVVLVGYAMTLRRGE